MYEERLPLYVDILGWTTAIRERGEDPLLLKAVQRVHIHAETHNERYRQELLSRGGKGERIFKMPLQVHFAAFSDHFVYSMPEAFGPRIITVASKLVLDLLRMGWLTRGAIVVGKLHHKDNAIFGPALLEAVCSEETKAIFPRVLISDEVIRRLEDWKLDPDEKIFLVDQLGSVVANPFAIPFRPAPEYAKELVESFVRLNFGFDEIRPLLDREFIAHRHAGKIEASR